jgi:hypothetical protein
LKEKKMTPTDCASQYLRYCLQKLPYNADAVAEVADIAPLTGTQYKAVQKAPQSKLASMISKLDKSLQKHAHAGKAIAKMQGGAAKLIDGPDTI